MPTDSPEQLPHDRPQVRLLGVVLGLRCFLFLIELGVGLQSHSLSLLAGSGHLFADLLTLGITLLSAGLMQQRSSHWVSLNYRRVTAWVGLLNGLSLSAIAVILVWEFTSHLNTPEPVPGLPLLMVAILSIGVNGLIVHLLQEEHHHDLNLRGVFLHGVADAASSIGLVLAAIAVQWLGWLWVDALVGLLIAALIGISALSLAADSLKELP